MYVCVKARLVDLFISLYPTPTNPQHIPIYMHPPPMNITLVQLQITIGVLGSIRRQFMVFVFLL